MSEATPPSGATPSQDGEQGKGNQPSPNQGKDGTVTITTAEYAQLQRQAARAKSAQRRVYQKPSKEAISVDSDDPAAAVIAEATRRAEEAEKRAMQLEIRGKVSDLLADDRFKGIPQSTRELILQSPQALSNAESLDEAMYDIEDKLIDIAGKTSVQGQPATQTQPANPPQQSGQTGKVETPPVVTPGTPAPVDSGVIQDTTNLRGTDRSIATLRNAFKKQKIGGVSG